VSRALRPTRNPQSVALAIMALRAYASDQQPRNDFEAHIFNALRQMDVAQGDATRLVRNFDRLSPIVRRRVFGAQGFADAEPSNGVPRREPRDVLHRRTGFPGVLRRFQRPGGPAAEIEEQVLAPNRYGVRYKGMHCIDETGWDRLGSDEVYIITSAVHITPDGQNEVETIRHPFQAGESGVYGDVDSGETRVGPVASCWSALVADLDGGMSITTNVMEHDEGDPDAYRDEVDKAVKLAIAVASYACPECAPILVLIDASGLVTDFFNWLLGTGDDVIGTSTVVLEQADLENYSRTPLRDYFRNQQPTGLRHHFLASVNDNDYVATFEVTRDPRAPLFEPVVE